MELKPIGTIININDTLEIRAVEIESKNAL
jgi:hypothetical protein